MNHKNCGERNHKAKHPDALVRRARLLRQRGYGTTDIRDLFREEGHDINRNTIATWVHMNTRATA